MKLKELPEDFIVEEILDLNSLNKEPEDKTYLYYYLTKTNYTQTKAIDIVAKTFNTNHKFVHIAGTKDRNGITKQLISIAKSGRMQPEKHREFFNQKFKDMNLEYVGEYPFRLNLGDNQGNKFEIILRQLSTDEISLARNRASDVSTKGVLNFFDSQRFGFAGNSHLVGLDVLRGDIENAVYRVLTSLPEHANEEHKEFVNRIETSWKQIQGGDREVINSIIDSAPKFLKQEITILKHFLQAKHDVSGAFRTIPKKLRTLYIGAYQGYIFNEVLRTQKDLPETLELLSAELSKETLEYEWYESVLKQDGVSQEDFALPHMPELRPVNVTREVRVPVWDLKIGEAEDDELHEGFFKVKIMFSLKPGAYATNVIKQLLE